MNSLLLWNCCDHSVSKNVWRCKNDWLDVFHQDIFQELIIFRAALDKKLHFAPVALDFWSAEYAKTAFSEKFHPF